MNSSVFSSTFESNNFCWKGTEERWEWRAGWRSGDPVTVRSERRRWDGAEGGGGWRHRDDAAVVEWQMKAAGEMIWACLCSCKMPTASSDDSPAVRLHHPQHEIIMFNLSPNRHSNSSSSSSMATLMQGHTHTHTQEKHYRLNMLIHMGSIKPSTSPASIIKGWKLMIANSASL